MTDSEIDYEKREAITPLYDDLIEKLHAAKVEVFKQNREARVASRRADEAQREATRAIHAVKVLQFQVDAVKGIIPVPEEHPLAIYFDRADTTGLTIELFYQPVNIPSAYVYRDGVLLGTIASFHADAFDWYFAPYRCTDQSLKRPNQEGPRKGNFEEIAELVAIAREHVPFDPDTTDLTEMWGYKTYGAQAPVSFGGTGPEQPHIWAPGSLFTPDLRIRELTADEIVFEEVRPKPAWCTGEGDHLITGRVARIARDLTLLDMPLNTTVYQALEFPTATDHEVWRDAMFTASNPEASA